MLPSQLRMAGLSGIRLSVGINCSACRNLVSPNIVHEWTICDLTCLWMSSRTA